MPLLFVDACPRGEGVSRTLAVAGEFLRAFRFAAPDACVITHRLDEMGLVPLTGRSLAEREARIDARDFSHAMFAPARDFARADTIVIAAPYWDLLFPAALKVYIEHMFIRELTFRYIDDKPVGLCAARRALFITTAGGKIAALNFGERYLRAALGMLGIARFDAIALEGIDMQGADTCVALADGARRARAFGENWQSNREESLPPADSNAYH